MAIPPSNRPHQLEIFRLVRWIDAGNELAQGRETPLGSSTFSSGAGAHPRSVQRERGSSGHSMTIEVL